MKPTTLIVWALACALPVIIIAGGMFAANSNDATRSGVPNNKPSIEGTYMLEYRILPDGKKVVAPDVFGMMTVTKEYRNFNVYWTAGGKISSISIISKYTLTEKAYTEESIYYASDFDSKGITYETTASHGTSAVTIKDGKTQFPFPLHGEPAGSFDKHGFIATMDGVFTDHWKKID